MFAHSLLSHLPRVSNAEAKVMVPGLGLVQRNCVAKLESNSASGLPPVRHPTTETEEGRLLPVGNRLPAQRKATVEKEVHFLWARCRARMIADVKRKHDVVKAREIIVLKAWSSLKSESQT